MRESTIEAKLKALCVLHGARVHKLHRCRNGEADRIICPRGRQAFYCEVKKPGEALSDTQVIRQTEAAKAGFATVIFDGSESSTALLFRFFNPTRLEILNAR